MAKRTSLKDIAQVVGVSTALVSYVLNNQKENRISREVAQRIRRAAEELNYQPNQAAKSLKTNKTNTLGLVVADIANPFSSTLARIIEDEADRQNYTVIFGSSDESAGRSQKLITTLLNRQVDGLLIAAPDGAEAQIGDLQERNVPFVLIDRYFPHLKTSYVALDNYQSLFVATEHLLDAGYERVGLITYKTGLFHLNERVRGYQTALRERKIPLRKRWQKEVSMNSLPTDVAKAVEELTTGPQRVEAIVFASNTLAVHGLRAIRAAALRVPDDVAVVSFDEADINDLFHNPLTYLRQPLLEMGQLATRILLETLTATDRITQANLKATLVVQASTQPVFGR